jgi:hypothetical protein
MERWTIDRCGMSVFYRVEFTVERVNGGTHFAIKPEASQAKTPIATTTAQP